MNVRGRTVSRDLSEDTVSSSAAGQWFEMFSGESSDGLRRALVTRFGVDVGCEVHADAMAYAWENADRLSSMDNPLGYLYRVGQSAARRHHRWKSALDLPAELPVTNEPMVEPGLDAALGELADDVRVAVVMVHSFGWSYAETAELIEVPESTVRNHVHRGLNKLRAQLGVDR